MDAIEYQPGTGFSTARTGDIVGVSYRQLDYWARTDLLRPSISEATGSGSRREYSYSDLLALKTIKSLLDAGIKLEQVRTVFEFVREQMDMEISAAHLVIEGTSVNLCNDGELIDVLRGGQGVLNVLSLGGVRSELDADIERTGIVPGLDDSLLATGS